MNHETVREHLKWRGFGIATDDSLLSFIELNDVVRKGVENPLFKSDVAKMQSILVGKGIRIGDDDPIFTLLAINDCVMRDALRNVVKEQKNVVARAHRATCARVLLPAIIGSCAGVLFGTRLLEPPLTFIAVIGCVLGIALGTSGTLYLFISGKIKLTKHQETS